MRAMRRLIVGAALPPELQALNDLAVNLRWSWNQTTQDLFAAIDPQVWDSVDRDPTALLAEVPGARLAELAADDGFVARVAEVSADLHEYLNGDRWYQTLAEDRPAAIGYFSPEYGITAALPQYSGGLGILAGDHLKAASDLGVPIIGVGLFYRAGYFRQSLSREGWQQETYPILDPDGLPLTVLREADGSPVRIEVALAEGHVAARVWVAHVGRVPLLLLDTDIEENSATLRDVTDRLYGGSSEHRLRQELLLGIGGVRAIRAFCRINGRAEPEVFHSNEGHAGFLGVERIRELVEQHGLTFPEALQAVRASTVFTTHTPVSAGIDRFRRPHIEAAFSGSNAIPGVPVADILDLGMETFEGGNPKVFNMAVMGLRLAQHANGVSKLHGVVSREMFGGLWPGFDEGEVPITSITNGVHAPTWVAPIAADLVRERVGSELLERGQGWGRLDEISDLDLWGLKREMRAAMINNARSRLRESWLSRGASDVELGWIDDVLDPDVLTIGFARRVPSYKRLTLMLHNPARLTALLTDPDRPVQIVVAGKAHPADEGGKRLIQQLVEFADDPLVRQRIVFLPDYDIAMAKLLYPGCDVWLNNPLRPLEACGTSGMKAALNGALNVSIRDGWWDEWFDGDNGWAIPTADALVDSERRDELEAAALYDLIESNVAARFYERSGDGLPTRWIEMVRHTIESLGPKVLASRMVRDYVVRLYVPAAVSGRRFAAHDYRLAQDLAQWKAKVRAQWYQVAVNYVVASGVSDSPQVGDDFSVHVDVSLGDLEPADVWVQLVHGRVDLDDRIVEPTYTELSLAESAGPGRWIYGGNVGLQRTGAFGYTVRVVPAHPGLTAAVELGLQAQPVAVPEGVVTG
ncbi:MAG: alpha-glucan family phosphorylase [Candidatus Nanopelagicales bacterium]